MIWDLSRYAPSFLRGICIKFGIFPNLVNNLMELYDNDERYQFWQNTKWQNTKW